MTWILSSNSWMQTPRGYSIDPTTGRFMPADWLAIIFNPSFPFRLVHMGLAAFLSVAFIVGATGAWHMLKARREGRIASEPVRVMFSMAMWMAAIVAPIQIMAGDAHGLNTLKYQPAKIAAMEGDWTSEGRAPELLFGIPNMKEERTDYAVKVPLLGSLILTHSLEGKVPGLKDFPVINGRHRLLFSSPSASWWRWACLWRLWGSGPSGYGATAPCLQIHSSIVLPCAWLPLVFWRCYVAGSPPKSAVSPGLFTACCARQTAFLPLLCPAWL